MERFINKVFAWIMAYQTLPTAAEQVESVLAGFPGIVEKLDAAIAQAIDEISASYDRVDEAYNHYREVADRESMVREETFAAEYAAEYARDNIAALIGEA